MASDRTVCPRRVGIQNQGKDDIKRTMKKRNNKGKDVRVGIVPHGHQTLRISVGEAVDPWVLATEDRILRGSFFLIVAVSFFLG